MLKKYYQVSLFVAFCILINYFGKIFALNTILPLSVPVPLPLWLDSVGTVFTAYLLGPVCGGIVGLTGNLVYAIITPGAPYSAYYGLINIIIGVIAGYAAKKGKLETIFGTLSVSVAITVASTAISTPLNILFFDGMTGNAWGDGVIDFLSERGWPSFLCSFVGEFYIDFADKVLTLMLLHLLVFLYRSFLKKHPEIPLSGALILLLLFVPCEKTAAAPIYDSEYHNFNAYVQTIYSSENGLPCGEANDITQTGDGVIWIGTYAGLYRYNGSEFRWMDEYDSVRSVNCLYVDSEGRMWIGTNDNGLSICINESLINVLDEKDGLPSNSVRKIIQSSDGYYYVGTSGPMQILELNSGINLLNTIEGVQYTCSLTADEDGHVAAVTSDGSLFLLGNREIVASKAPFEDEIFTCAAFSPEGILYVGTSAGRILVMDVSGDELKQIKIQLCDELININRLYFSDAGILFVCADNGIGYFDGYHFDMINSTGFRNSVDNMCEDYQGNLWFASSRLGVLCLSNSSFIDVYKAVGLEEKVVNSVDFWNGNYYVGTDTGLDVLDAELGHKRKSALSEKLDGLRVRCVRTDSHDRLWLSTYGMGTVMVEKPEETSKNKINAGLFSLSGNMAYEDADDRITVYDSQAGDFGNRSRMTLELSDGAIAAVSETGVSFIKKDGTVDALHSGSELPAAMVLCMLETDDGRLLAGTDGDGIAVIRYNGVVRSIGRNDGLTSGVILRMVESSEGGIYIVTSNGLCYEEPGGEIRELKNFPYYNNYDIWRDQTGRLFVLGSAGIYVVDEAALLAGEELDYVLLDVKKGLSSALTANSWDMCDERGNLFLSGDKGLFIFNIRDYLNEARSYRMMLSSVMIDGEKRHVTRGTPITIGRNTARIELFPEVINYTVEDPVVTYMLEGFDQVQNETVQSALSGVAYTNLPTGEYTFHISVLGANKKVLEESRYTLIKEKEIYDTKWFAAYMVIIALAIAVWLTAFVVRVSNQRTIDLQKKTMDIQKRELDLAHKQLAMGNQTILAIAKTVDAKDENTSLHSQRVSEYSVLIAERLGFDAKECNNLKNAALLHDIGKIGIPDSILNKPSRLDDAEYAQMKSHVTKGAEILKDFTLIDHVIEGALYHHERYDGKGYAKGYSGDDIPLYGRIIGVADAFDAMTANRVYRRQLSIDHVIDELKNGRGTQFDPQIVDILLELIEDGTINVDELYADSKKETPGDK